MAFLGIVYKIRLKYSKELLDYKVINKYYNKSYNESSYIKIIFPMKLNFNNSSVIALFGEKKRTDS